MQLCRVHQRSAALAISVGLIWSSLASAAPIPTKAPPPAIPTVHAASSAPSTKVSPWARIAMIGASVSAGFTLSEPLGGSNTPQYRLSRYLDAAILSPHDPVKNWGNTLFFMQPEPLGRAQVNQAIKSNPTIVVGIDFLFWFCYGDAASDAERLQRFETGLKILEAVKCPLVLGDIPDASAAVNILLRAEQIPPLEVMTAANRRLKDWAASRPDVRVIPLSEIMRSAIANQSITVHGYIWPNGSTRALLQDDRLHTSTKGCAALAMVITDAIVSMHPQASNDVRWNPAEILSHALETPVAIRGPAQTSTVAPGK